MTTTMMTREEILHESYGDADECQVAHYESAPFETSKGEEVIETTTDIQVIVVGRDEIGYTLVTRDDADGPRDEAGKAVYPTLGAAILAAEAFVGEQEGGEILPLIGRYAEAYEAAKSFTAVSARVADPKNMGDNVNDYPSEWSGAVIVTLRRGDGIEADIYIEAGVPDYLVGTAQASRSSYGLEQVWLFGDSRDMWCPKEFRANDHHAMLDAAHDAALRAWGNYDGPRA